MFKPVERAYRFIGKQAILLAPSDLRDFSAALRREYPQIRFYRYRDRGEVGRIDSFGPPTSPPDATAARVEPAPEDPADKSRPPKRLVFFDSFVDCDSWGSCTAQIVPEDWIPEWSRNSEGEWINTNSPESPSFDMQFPTFLSNRRRGVFRTEIHAQFEDEEITLQYGRWYGGYYPWEDEKRKFLLRARRIFQKMTTNKYSVVDTRTLAVVERVSKGGVFWIGGGALEWARAHPRHFLVENCKPIDWNPP